MKSKNIKTVFLRTIIFWYLFLLVLALSSTFNVDFISIAPGFILTAIVYIFIAIGFHGGSNIKLTAGIKPRRLLISRKTLVLLAFASAVYSINFYTGKTAGDVIESVLAGDSLYNNYQAYFADEGLENFSASKIFPIVAGGVLKFTLLYTFITFLILKIKLDRKDILTLIIVSLAYLYFAIGRGTSFELFELFVIFIYCLILRNSSFAHKKNPKIKWIVMCIGVAFVWLYSINVSARYGVNEISDCAAVGFCLDKQSFIYSNFPGLGRLLFLFSGYFIFGILHTAKMLMFVFDSASLTTGAFIPGSGLLSGVSTADATCIYVLDCGAMWTSDISRIFSSFGIFGLISIAFIIGKFGLIALRSAYSENMLSANIVAYFIFLFILSLPIGNFVTASSPNIINALIASLIFIYLKFSLRRD